MFILVVSRSFHPSSFKTPVCLLQPLEGSSSCMGWGGQIGEGRRSGLPRELCFEGTLAMHTHTHTHTHTHATFSSSMAEASASRAKVTEPRAPVPKMHVFATK